MSCSYGTPQLSYVVSSSADMSKLCRIKMFKGSVVMSKFWSDLSKHCLIMYRYSLISSKVALLC